jgi:hypothetical protein
MVKQADLDAVTDKLDVVHGSLLEGVGELRAEIQRLANAAPQLDLTRLNAAAEKLASLGEALDTDSLGEDEQPEEPPVDEEPVDEGVVREPEE